MTGHTPGPWLREGRTIYALNEQDTNRMCVYVQSAAPAAHTGDDAEQEANACLIAAASELLAALQTLIDAIGGELGGTDTPDMTDAINAASSAIAKATGEEVTA